MKSRVMLLTTTALCLVLACRMDGGPPESAPRPAVDEVNTFSIVALDPDQRELGVAVASKYLAVGSAVPWAKADVGAIATQAQVNTTYGPNGLLLMAQGKSAFDTLKILTDADPQKVFRQAGV